MKNTASIVKEWNSVTETTFPSLKTPIRIRKVRLILPITIKNLKEYNKKNSWNNILHEHNSSKP